ncbi:sialidase family protein, partial [Candidatus Hodarchaeum mangrovi]
MAYIRFITSFVLISILICIFSFQYIEGDLSSTMVIREEILGETSDSFGESIKIPGIEGSFAVIATDNNGGVYIAYQGHWVENSNDLVSFHVYFAYSHDYGKSWSESFRINDNESTSVQCDSPAIAIDKTNGHIFVAWKDNRTGVANVYIDKSIDRGISFESDVKVSNSSTDYVPPWLPFTVNLEISNHGKIYVTWLSYTSSSFTDCQILFTNSLDGGQTFYTPIIIQSTETETIFAHPWVAIDSNNILYVVYSKRDSISANVYLTKSQNGGLSFETPIKVNDGSTQRYCGGTKVSVSPDGSIHVVWTDNRAGDGPQYLDIYYTTSKDSGLSFGSNIRVNDDLDISPPVNHPHFTRGAQGSPSITIDS